MNALAQLGQKPRFTPEFDLLTACCRIGSSGVSSVLSAAIDCKILLESAEHHRLIPALFTSLASQTTVPLSRPFRERARLHAWRSLQSSAELLRIAAHFKGRGIAFLAYKGPALAQLLYGDTTARQFGDLDILVAPSDVGRSKSALVELKYQSKLQLSARREDSYLRAGYEYAFRLDSERPTVELQWRLVPSFFSIDFDMNAMFKRSIEIDLEGTPLRTLCREDSMLALCVHAAKHGWCQLAMTRDIIRLASFDLDWEWIATEASRLGILRILQVSLLVGQTLLECDLPANDRLSHSGDSPHEIAERVIDDLAHNREPNTESVSYFKAQSSTRERRRDRLRFVWRLAITPGISEWNTLGDGTHWSGFDRLVRLARLAKRFGLPRLNRQPLRRST